MPPGAFVALRVRAPGAVTRGPSTAQLTLREQPARGQDCGVTGGDGRTSGDKDKDNRLASALRQQAINEVLLKNDGQQDNALIISALTDALTQRGLTTPTTEWLDGVATEVALGHTYVVSADSLQAAAALEMPDEPHFAIAEPSLSGLQPESTTSSGSDDSRAESLEDGRAESLEGKVPASSQTSDSPRSQSATRNRDRLVAAVLVVVGVAVWARALRSRPRVATVDATVH